MINREDAERIAQQFIRGLMSADLNNLIIIPDSIREEEFGWVFSYNDRRYLETGDMSYCVYGNQPVVVLRRTGDVQHLPLLPVPDTQDREALAEAFVANRNIDLRIKAFAASIKRDEAEEGSRPLE